jgi:hypothetical protein
LRIKSSLEGQLPQLFSRLGGSDMVNNSVAFTDGCWIPDIAKEMNSKKGTVSTSSWTVHLSISSLLSPFLFHFESRNYTPTCTCFLEHYSAWQTVGKYLSKLNITWLLCFSILSMASFTHPVINTWTLNVFGLWHWNNYKTKRIQHFFFRGRYLIFNIEAKWARCGMSHL